MSIIIAVIIEFATIAIVLLNVFSGNMRTMGETDDDEGRALRIFIGGTTIAVLIGASHWIGW